MSDYIERKSIRNLYSCLNPEDKVRVAQVLTDIDAIPSDDVVSVVRCKECKYWNPWHCSQFNDHTHEVDFCSYGERKDNGNVD